MEVEPEEKVEHLALSMVKLSLKNCQQRSLPARVRAMDPIMCTESWARVVVGVVMAGVKLWTRN